MSIETEIDPFFQSTDFAQSVTVAGTGLLAIFDHAFIEDLAIEGEAPILHCKSADLPGNLAHGDAVTVATASYTIVGIQPDGTGVTILILEEA